MGFNFSEGEIRESKEAERLETIRSSNKRLEAYAVKPQKLEELWGGEPQPHVGT